MINKVTTSCELAFSKLSQEQKDKFHAHVTYIGHWINSSSPETRKIMTKEGYKKTIKFLGELCPDLCDLDIKLITAIVLSCVDDLIQSRVETLREHFPDLVDIVVSMQEATLKKSLLESEGRYQKQIDLIEQELEGMGWQDTKDGKIERKLTFLHSIQRARATSTSMYTLTSSSERANRYGNSKKYQKLIKS